MRLRRCGPVAVAALMLAGALTGCSEGSSVCDPQAMLDQDQAGSDVIAADDLAVMENIDGSTTRLLTELGDDGALFYLGASSEGESCLIIVADGPVAGCSGGASVLKVSNGSIDVELVAESDADAAPSGARTEAVPEGCLAIRTS